MTHLMTQSGYSQLPYSRLKLLCNHDPPYGSEFKSCVKVEVAVLGFPS